MGMPMHPQYKTFAPRWKKWRDASQGEDAIKEGKTQYLPKLLDQGDEEYADYLRRAAYYNATGKTVSALSGALFYHDPTFSLPPDLESLEKGQGRKGLDAQVKQAGKELVTVGRLGLLGEVDKEGKPRLYLYSAESIINWQFDEECTLQWVILLESKSKHKGEFESEYVPRWRILQLIQGVYYQRVFEIRKTDEQEALVEVERATPTYRDGTPLDFLPFVLLDYETDEEGQVGYSPISDLANVNVHHYMLTADLRHVLHLTACPMLNLRGLSKADQRENIRVGSSTVVYTNADGGGEFIEVSGQGAGVIREELIRLEDQMSRLGVAALRAAKADAETEQSIRLQQKGESSVLSTVCSVLTTGFTRIGRLFGQWYGLDAKAQESISIAPSKEFFDVKISIPEAEFFFKLYLHGDLTLEDLLDTLQGGGVLQEEIYQRALERARKTVKTNETKENPNPSPIPGDRPVLHPTGQPVGA